MKLEKLVNKLGKETASELEGKSRDELMHSIVTSEQAMSEAQAELDANPKYQELKENLKAITAGKKEVNGRQRAVIAYCLHLLESKGA